MEAIAQRLMRYNRLLAPDALRMLSETPALLTDLEAALSSGKPLPTIIGVPQLAEVSGNASAPPCSPVAPQMVMGPTMMDDGMDRTAIHMNEGLPVSAGITVTSREEMAPAGPRVASGPQPIPTLPPLAASDGMALNLRGAFRPRAPASEVDGDVMILMDPAERLGSSGKIEDFRNLFLDRYRSLRGVLLRQNPDLSPITDIANIYGSEEELTVIGMVSDLRTTKNGHQMLILEDPTGSVRALLSKNKEVSKVRFVNDEVLAISGRYKSGDGRGTGIIFADKVVRVDVPQSHRRRVSTSKGILAAFTSDTHVGSRMYLTEDWERMVSWLRGERDANLPADMGRAVKYLVISGDLVDGIGVYPEQEKDLLIMDIYKQYEALAASLSRLPEHIELILMPGNHDAVRLAEPQPPLPRELQGLFANSNIHFLSNPTHFALSGVHVSAYHGRSLDDLVTLFKDVTYENPIQGMKEMLRMRHFSPCYGMRNQLSPEETDMLVMGEVPDIFVSGHVHRFEMDVYRGVQMVQGSTWQSQTKFQKLMNFKPQPSRMGLIDLGDAQGVWGWSLN